MVSPPQELAPQDRKMPVAAETDVEKDIYQIAISRIAARQSEAAAALAREAQKEISKTVPSSMPDFKMPPLENLDSLWRKLTLYIGLLHAEGKLNPRILSVLRRSYNIQHQNWFKEEYKLSWWGR